jgi:SAM-dependent methyltransferase
MELNDIDWNSMWRDAQVASPWSKESRKELWEKKADGFNDRILRVKSEASTSNDKDNYIDNMLQRIYVEPDFTVLDIGCGPGTLTILLAKKTKTVTGLDIAAQMLKHLKDNAAQEHLNNISYINADWDDAISSNLVEPHDVVVASRCLHPVDIKSSFARLSSIARHSVYVTVPVVHLPFDWEIYRVIGRNHVKHPSYIYIINALFQMGIQANLEILYSRVKINFATIEQVIEDLQWRTTPFTETEKAKLTRYVEDKFAEQNGSFTHEGKSKWALIWWNVKDNGLFKDYYTAI